MIVVDASAVVLGLLNDGDARRSLANEPVAIPHLADSEVVQAFRSQVLRGSLTRRQARRALDQWAQLGVRRFGAVGLHARMWELRDNVSAYDATYVALAEAMECSLLTGDRRLANAPGPTCPMIVVRS